MNKKLYILYTDKMKQPDYGYFKSVRQILIDFFKYMTVNNFKKWKNPSLFWSIRSWIRHRNFFGYWTSYRRWEESMKHEEYMNTRYKTLAWLRSLIN